MSNYFYPEGGLPPQTQLLTDRAVVKEAYTVIPKGVLRDIVTSNLPGWTNTRSWIIARPIAGFATTFSQLIVEVAPGGGSDKPEPEAGVEGVIFLTKGELTLTLDGEIHQLEEGGYAYLAAGRPQWSWRTSPAEIASFQWIRKAYEPLDGYTAKSFVTRDQDVEPRRDAGHRRRLGHHPLRGPGRPGPRHARQHRHVPARRLHPVRRKPTSWSTASSSWRAKPSTGSTTTGWRWRPATSCGCAPSARRPATPAARATFRYLLYKDVNRQIRLT